MAGDTKKFYNFLNTYASVLELRIPLRKETNIKFQLYEKIMQYIFQFFLYQSFSRRTFRFSTWHFKTHSLSIINTLQVFVNHIVTRHCM